MDVLYNELDPNATRSLHWTEGTPRISPVPIGSPGDQPFYGENTNFKPIVVRPVNEPVCFVVGNFSDEYCINGIRNNPAP